MMGFCGLYCTECPAYKGTVRSDLKLLEETAKDWSTADHSYGVKDVICLGCTQPDSRLVSSWCKRCLVRACALGNRVTNCVVCPDFDSCAKIGELFERLAKPTLEMKMGLMRQKVLTS